VTDTPNDPLIGKTISQYHVISGIGGGGMGVVYRARDTRLGRTVALKFLPPQWSYDEGARERFIREAQAASATNHRNICVVHDIGQADDGQLFIVMAYYEGQTLKRKLKDGALPVVDAVEIATEIAEGLAKAHAQGVVHRDVKPGNLMLTEDGVKILDFGLAKFADALQLTIQGSTVGTVAYMSPEQARGDEAGPASDVWALGVVLYEMLTGSVPFKGTYAEAILHAIKNEDVPVLCTPSGQPIPAALEAIMLRALAKDVSARYESARGMARDLRELQGRTVPLDLVTGPVPSPQWKGGSLRRRPSWRQPAIVSAIAVALVILSLSVWIVWPVTRVPVVVAPVSNQSGFSELDDYRLALTGTLVAELGDSASIRVPPYERMLQIVRRFLLARTDVSSREVIQALTANTQAQFVLVPTLLYENGSWRARVEVRDTMTATNVAAYDTDPVVSSLTKETAHGLMGSLVGRVQQHFAQTGPRRAHIRDFLTRVAGRQAPAIVPPLRTLEAAKAFDDGLQAYEQLEYAAAKTGFERAAAIDVRSPLAFAWLSRVAVLMRQNESAQQAGDRAASLLDTRTSAVDRLFVEAVSLEARREGAAAEAKYRDLVARQPDEPAGLVELAAFQDRRGRAVDAVASYHQALAMDPQLARPHLELCRLYNRLTESANAKREGQIALTAYRALGNRGGEGQSLMCLTDGLRLGSEDERLEARRDAEAALKIFQEINGAYNLARAQNYVASAAEMQGRPAEALALWEQSLTAARNAGNTVLQPLVQMALGAMYEQTGNHTQALAHYRESYTLYEALGDQQRAAQNRANAAAILIEYSGRAEVEEGRRELSGALAVFRKFDDTYWEVFATKINAAFFRLTGRFAEAEAELNRALGLARTRDLSSSIAALTADLGRSLFERGEYAAARDRLLEALAQGVGKDTAQTRIHLGRLHVRLGDFEEARRYLNDAAADVHERGDNGLLPMLHLALGELAHESGRAQDARTALSSAAALWTDDLPDPESVEARALLGTLDGIAGQFDRGKTAIEASLDQAVRAGRPPLEVQCRVLLARVLIAEERFDEAVTTLSVVKSEGENPLGPELAAQVHYWRSVALAGRDAAAAEAEATTARALVGQLQASLPMDYRDTFVARRSIAPIVR